MITTASDIVRANFPHNRFQQGLVALFAAFWLWSAIAPVYPFDWLLENMLVVVAVAVIVASHRRVPLSDLSYAAICAFLCLHAIGAHYTYSEVPFGFWLRDTLDLTRNHYDRIVHFSSGLLLVYPFRELFLRYGGAAARWSTLAGLTMVFSFSAAYEIIEMMVAIIVAPEAGQAYLGTQGDEFDAQKDMGLAASGAMVTLAARTAITRAG